MKFHSFEIVIEKEPEDEGYFAYSPTVPGCFSNGKTIEEAKTNIRETLEQHIFRNCSAWSLQELCIHNLRKILFSTV